MLPKRKPDQVCTVSWHYSIQKSGFLDTIPNEIWLFLAGWIVVAPVLSRLALSTPFSSTRSHSFRHLAFLSIFHFTIRHGTLSSVLFVYGC